MAEHVPIPPWIVGPERERRPMTRDASPERRLDQLEQTKDHMAGRLAEFEERVGRIEEFLRHEREVDGVPPAVWTTDPRQPRDLGREIRDRDRRIEALRDEIGRRGVAQEQMEAERDAAHRRIVELGERLQACGRECHELMEERDAAQTRADALQQMVDAMHRALNS